MSGEMKQSSTENESAHETLAKAFIDGVRALGVHEHETAMVKALARATHVRTTFKPLTREMYESLFSADERWTLVERMQHDIGQFHIDVMILYAQIAKLDAALVDRLVHDAMVELVAHWKETE